MKRQASPGHWLDSRLGQAGGRGVAWVTCRCGSSWPGGSQDQVGFFWVASPLLEPHHVGQEPVLCEDVSLTLRPCWQGLRVTQEALNKYLMSG